MFVDRQSELIFLNQLLARQKAHLVLLYGRRRVGKTSLLLHWAGQTQVETTYWAAEKEPGALQRRKLYAQVLSIPVRRAPLFDSWAELWEAIADWAGSRRHILILDELPYAIESDPATLSALQHAWDQRFQNSNLVIVLCGSQVKVMESILYQQSPLFGRLTGQWHLQPLPFASLREFYPSYSAEERVALYAMVGGVPAYLDWLDQALTLTENIRQVVLQGGSMFLAEPTFLLYDEVREPQSYLAILKAIGAGNHTLDEISSTTLIGKSHLSSYLARLQELKMVERRLPVLMPPAQRRNSRSGRYHLLDAYFRFYFRFIAPFAAQLPFYPEPVLAKIQQELRAFVGQTAFENLAQQWVLAQGRQGQLPFIPELVGYHWQRNAQIDVAAVNWSERVALIGECKWGNEPISKQTVRELFERKTQRLQAKLAKHDRQLHLHYALFARAGFTPAALDYLAGQDAQAITLEQLDKDLSW
ncbi:MAG: ATP-binding protein [Anaerolineales bacterium]|nr:ATP-binding protein [Anaerolineales bacterium]